MPSLFTTTLDPAVMAELDAREAAEAKPENVVGRLERHEPKPLTDRELAVLDSFAYHAPTPEQTARIDAIRFHYTALARFGMLTVRDSADRTAGLRQLHESQMTMLKAIVCEPGSMARVYVPGVVEQTAEPYGAGIAADDPNPGV